jgi:iron(III) transport system ATP-binding protein
MYLSLDHIVKVFPPRGGSVEVTAVDGISLDIEKGELVTLLGPSGCGKTTVLRMIAGFEFPTSGTIRLDGKEIDMLPPNQRGMSMVFQSYAIFPHLNVLENIAYGLKVMRLPKPQLEDRLNRIMELVQLAGLEQRAPNQLSGGQQQRVALARALVMEPKVLLMDEPLSNLDAKLREQMRTEIRRIQKELGITSVYVTHDQLEAMTLSDRVVVLRAGKIEQSGSPTEIYRYPNSRFVANFIGRANFLIADVKDTASDQVVVEVFGKLLALSREYARQHLPAQVTLVIRPEMIQVNPPDPILQGTIRRANFLGSSIDYDIEVQGILLTAVETDPMNMSMIPEGSQVGISFCHECIHLLPQDDESS